MESAEVYFRVLEPLVGRENFLEKAMLDSEVHHLEVRTSFFDKLAVLASGSIALGITFLAAGYEHNSLLSGIQQHLSCIAISISLLLLSLFLCVIHNYLISFAVSALAKQVESVYNSAHVMTLWFRNHPGSTGGPIDSSTEKLIAQREGVAEQHRLQKLRRAHAANLVGVFAVAVLVFGYLIGLIEILAVIAESK